MLEVPEQKAGFGGAWFIIVCHGAWVGEELNFCHTFAVHAQRAVYLESRHLVCESHLCYEIAV